MKTRHFHLWQRCWKRIGAKSEELSSDIPEGVFLSALRDVPCLVLLGAPGLGKTSEIHLEAQSSIARGEAADIISLGRLTSIAELESLVISKVKRLELQGRIWNLFLDGLDESLSQITQSHDALSSIFRKVSIHKELGEVKLRLTCRSAEWPSLLEASLKDIWGEVGTQTYELQELSEADIKVAASELPPERTQAFLSQIERREVEALAKRPVTLNMLLDVFEQHSELPVKRAQLYREALLSSIDASNKNRRDVRLDARSQLMVAARIAAASIFSNSTEIAIDVRSVQEAGRIVAISEISGGYEPADSGSFPVEEVELQQALLTPLFAPVGETLFVWSHQTFAEFLAAYYLIERKLTPQSILDFLRSAEGDRIPPQLSEVSAWLASMDGALFNALTESNPEILLSSDVASASPEARESLVRGLLERFDRAELHDFNLLDRLRYDRLGHPRLAEQLLPYIVGRGKDIVARRAAIDIAEANGGLGISHTLASIALDPTENLHIRTQAAAAVEKVGDDASRLRLRELIHGSPADENDELKGWALKALWPKHLSVKELVASLTPEKNSSWIGSYASFVSTLELPELNDADAQEVLGWIAVVASYEERDYTFDRAIPRILNRVWDSIDRPAVLSSVAELFLGLFSSAKYTILQRSADDILSRISRESGRRLSLVQEIVKRSTSESWSWLAYAFPFPLLTLDDLPWLLERIRSPSEQFPEAAAAQLILAVMPKDSIEEYGAVWAAAEDSEVLSSGLQSLFSCQIDSPTSNWQRDDYKRRQSEQADVKKKRFDALQALENRLRTVEAENSFGWWELNLAFLANEQGILEGEFKSDLTETPLWANITDFLRDRLFITAVRYLTENKLVSSSWVGTNTFHRPAAAGYRALRLLLKLDRAAFLGLTAAAWRDWCASIFVSFNEDSEGIEARNIIVRRAYELAPDRVQRLLVRLFRKGSEFDARNAVRLLDQSYDERLGAFLWAMFRRLAPGKVRAIIIGCLARQSYAPVVSQLLHDLDRNSTLPNDVYSIEEFVAGASSVLQSDPATVWPVFSRYKDRNTELALQIVRSFDYESSFTSKMSEMDLADFFIWTYREIPPPSDKERGGARWVGPDEEIDQLRHGVLRRLTTLGTPLAVASALRIATEVAEAPWLKYHVLDARRALDATTWRLREPSEVVATIALQGSIEPPRSTKTVLESNAAAGLDALQGVEEVLQALPSERIEAAIQDFREPSRINRRTILSVATEWRSGHGGVSTLNRELCIALARLGHEVTCIVLNAAAHEISQARAAGVQIVTPRPDPFIAADDIIARLLLFSKRGLDEYAPELVIGHDHITGSAARHIAQDVYGVPYIHFVHTLPEEIERHKTRGSQSVLKGAMKAQVQIEQCKSANMVVAIGPRIFRQISGRLSRADVPVVQMWPGLNPALVNHVVDVSSPRGADCLLIARFEDPVLKGAPIACHAISKINSNWRGDPWTRPKLIMRGFTFEGVDDEIRAIDGYKAAEPYVTCRPYTQIEDEIAEDICGASVILMPSASEGFGLSALEAIAAGIPALISAESGLAQLLIQEKLSPAVASIAREWVVDVTGKDTDVITADWALRIERIVANPEAAFDQARRLKADLSSVLSWENTARRFSMQIEECLFKSAAKAI
ncbi:glycosyltransferase family 4 protein [Bradyrhizobium australiense]|uniref:Glycosyltransferase n=1 Tax=Bradyrhizobium australiense TaxID=2721161 RepID=A0A7Y4LVA8_9BRAD|nr:glycosyltransferase family 4 protein [Bradyrhizobium australiense]NOJ39976.1 glycosyltransferase [Bradyrhizobium australiense]